MINFLKLKFSCLRQRFGESQSVHLFTSILRTIFRLNKLRDIMANSERDSERKFHDNIQQLINETLKNLTRY